MDEVKNCDNMLAWIEWDEEDHTRLEVFTNKFDRDQALEAECQNMLKVCCASNKEFKAIMDSCGNMTARERLVDHREKCEKLDFGHFVPFITAEEPKVQAAKGDLIYLLLQCKNFDDRVEQIYAFTTDEELDEYWAVELMELLNDEDVGDVDLEKASVDELENLYEKTDNCMYYFRRIISVAK